MSDFYHSYEHAPIARNVYEVYASLIDDQVKAHEEATKDNPELPMALLHGMYPAARFNVLDVPSAETLDGPFTRLLARTAIIAFQLIEAPDSDQVRKFELLDPFQTSGNPTLLLLSLWEHDRSDPELPGALVVGGQVDHITAPPFTDRELTEDLALLVHTVRELSEAGSLAPVLMDDVQSMYKLHADLKDN